ncbi:MAG: ArsA family ATPase [Acidobacteriia bacterium]|nr:ArsA family ATPase [Terriglobia bacterium]
MFNDPSLDGAGAATRHGTAAAPPAHEAAEERTPSFLNRRCLQLLLFGGKGGVGKTTCAVASALHLAHAFPGRVFLLVSTDPAHSLADSLAGAETPSNLRVLELDALTCLAAFKAKHAEKLGRIASLGTFLDEEDIGRFLNLSLPGLDELMAFLEISGYVRSRDYDCVLVDTAPSGHALRVLEMPDLIGKWLGALNVLLAKHRYMKKTFGNARPDDLDLFLEDLAGSVREMEKLLQDPSRCQFIPVMLAEALSVRETLSVLDRLRQMRLPVTEILINQLYPENGCMVCRAGRNRNSQEIEIFFRALNHLRYAIYGIPLHASEIRGGGALRSFWKTVERVTAAPEALPVRKPLATPPVDEPARPPAAKVNLLVFGGKGGVGKTTLACATAVWLAREHPGKKVLLFSSDPAHALSNCLDQSVGSSPRVIFPGLTAIEIDAHAEFDALKSAYAEDLERFFTQVSGNFDLAFDREVMEKFMDLAPSGLDEVMALLWLIESQAQRAYDIYVLDSAATGHLVRLLELPALIQSWIKAVFEVLLKNRNIFRLAQFSRTLVEMSKNLNKLRKLLCDPDRTHLYAVSIPTEMALEETKDLVACCERNGINIPAVFLNLLTPVNNCPLCTAIHQREFLVVKKFNDAFPEKRHTHIYRRDEPHGVDMLIELGGDMFMPAGKKVHSHAS